MAKSVRPQNYAAEQIAYGLLVAALGCIWLLVELGWLHSSFPLGPLTIIIIGIVMLLPWLKKGG
ncbi:MAG: hypothetical protein N3G80_02140 [Candidatus Micrarchaeota archaeon]|nr:hypothetical protein [Candidatus Micrarchaeota archaeon]